MVHGRLKSRTMRRVHVKTPGGKTVKRYLRRKPGRAQCAECQKFLHGIPNLARHQMRNLAKTERRPERPFGGVLCSVCSRERLRARVTAQQA